MYKIFCKQRGQSFADDETFETLEDCRDQLISYHSIDCDEASLNEQSLADLCDGFEWEILDSHTGDTIDYEILKTIK